MNKQLGKVWLSVAAVFLLGSCVRTNPADVYPADRIASSCQSNSLKIAQKVVVSDLYVDRPYLDIMIPRLNHGVYLDELVSLMFSMGLQALETQNTDFGNPLVFEYSADSQKKVIRLSIKPAGSPECRDYRYAQQYPAQALPWLRGLGLHPDSCIAIQGLPTETASSRIYVKRQLVGRQFNDNNTQWRFDVTLVDASATPPSASASMTVHYAYSSGAKGGSRERFLCGDVQAQAFREAFSGSGNSVIRVPQTVSVPPKEALETLQETPIATLNSLVWIIRPEKKWSTNLINPEGTAWVGASRGISERTSYAFNVFHNGTIYQSPIVLSEIRNPDVTGLAKSKTGFALVVGRNPRRPDEQRFLVQFDEQGQNVATSKLSHDQYDALVALP